MNFQPKFKVSKGLSLKDPAKNKIRHSILNKTAALIFDSRFEIINQKKLFIKLLSPTLLYLKGLSTGNSSNL